MNRQMKARLALLVTLLASAVVLTGLRAEDKNKQAGNAAAASPGAAVKPKTLSEATTRGLAYLLSQQQPNGGWGQGGGWRSGQGGRVEGPNVQDPPDVASTCMATLALIRAGNTPKEGKHAKSVARAVEFICSHIEKADTNSLFVTDVRDTQVQTKIGPYVDTFLASMVLAELKGKMPAEIAEKRLEAALTKTVAKIEKNQKEDGTFAGNNGWASIFSQGLASKALNRARQHGVAVKSETLARAEQNARFGFDEKSGTFKSSVAAGGSGVSSLSSSLASASGRPVGLSRAAPALPAATDAGVPVYFSSNQLAGLQESLNTAKSREKEAKRVLADKNATIDDRDRARADLGRLGRLERGQSTAIAGLARQLGDKQFVQGFGSNGGEEFLSYLNISETLVVKGGTEWEKWDKSVTENLNRIQNQDGSWSGQHCITGRTICTAAALMVLMADRTPIPAAAPDNPASQK